MKSDVDLRALSASGVGPYIHSHGPGAAPVTLRSNAATLRWQMGRRDDWPSPNRNSLATVCMGSAYSNFLRELRSSHLASCLQQPRRRAGRPIASDDSEPPRTRLEMRCVRRGSLSTVQTDVHTSLNDSVSYRLLVRPSRCRPASTACELIRCRCVSSVLGRRSAVPDRDFRSRCCYTNAGCGSATGLGRTSRSQTPHIDAAARFAGSVTAPVRSEREGAPRH